MADELTPEQKALKDAEYARDTATANAAKLQKELEDVRKQLPSKEQQDEWAALKASAAQAEEDRKKKAGEWEALRSDLQKKHEGELSTRDGKVSQLTTFVTESLIANAFAGAYDEKTPWFGGDDAKTVLSADLAAAAFRPYIEVQTIEQDGKLSFSIGVKHPETGRIITDREGKPAKFAVAIGEHIAARSDKDRILRGSGKTGSGSSGGSTGDPTKVDLHNLTPEQRRDPAVLQAIKDSLPKGGVVMGEAYDR
jgi:hypothetical protein